MKHTGFIEGRKVQSSRQYIVHSDELGVVAECPSLDATRKALEREDAKCKEWEVEPHLTIFQWSERRWSPAISLYDLLEVELKNNPALKDQVSVIAWM